MTQKIPLNRPNFCSAPAEKVTELEELLNKKDQEMKVMEDRYKKYLEKAKSVSRRIRSKLLLYMKCHKFTELTTYLTTEFEINLSFHALQWSLNRHLWSEVCHERTNLKDFWECFHCCMEDLGYLGQMPLVQNEARPQRGGLCPLLFPNGMCALQDSPTVSAATRSNLRWPSQWNSSAPVPAFLFVATMLYLSLNHTWWYLTSEELFLFHFDCFR